MQNVDLKQYNTFGVQARAERFAVFSTIEELEELVDASVAAPMILGGGSNVLFRGDVAGMVLHNQIKGINIVNENAGFVELRAGAGEVWHHFVMYCVERGLGGLENLSLIPGNVGASPMQNIGAYGVEIKDVFVELEAIHLREKYLRRFTAGECRFGYRDSIFKNELKHQFVILSVTLRLSKHPDFNISYGTIGKQLESMGVKELSVKAISEAVIAIRQQKLPDPQKLGNAGSFFKNPILEKEIFSNLQEQYPDIPHYEVGDKVKVPAAWLIEQCGFKGKRTGAVGCYKNQPLVLVNFGGATGSEIYAFSENIINTVHDTFGIELNREVNVIDS